MLGGLVVNHTSATEWVWPSLVRKDDCIPMKLPLLATGATVVVRLIWVMPRELRLWMSLVWEALLLLAGVHTARLLNPVSWALITPSPLESSAASAAKPLLAVAPEDSTVAVPNICVPLVIGALFGSSTRKPSPEVIQPVSTAVPVPARSKVTPPEMFVVSTEPLPRLRTSGDRAMAFN